MNKKYVTPKEAAELLGISTATLRRWDKSGAIKSVRTHGNQRRYVLEEEDTAQKPIVCADQSP